jgi:hypothetical protein
MRQGGTILEEKQARMRDRQQAASPAAVSAVSHQGFAERHLTVEDVAGLWNLSHDSVRRLFEREPGVLVIVSPRGFGSKRRYRTLRIPESVAARVYRRMLNPPRN